jgi:hypothetical protein
MALSETSGPGDIQKTEGQKGSILDPRISAALMALRYQRPQRNLLYFASCLRRWFKPAATPLVQAKPPKFFDGRDRSFFEIVLDKQQCLRIFVGRTIGEPVVNIKLKMNE